MLNDELKVCCQKFIGIYNNTVEYARHIGSKACDSRIAWQAIDAKLAVAEKRRDTADGKVKQLQVRKIQVAYGCHSPIDF